MKRHVAIARFTNETKYGQSFCLDQNRLIETLQDKPWRAYLLSYQNGAYLVSGGKSQGIRAGDVFSVYQKGEKVQNPQTGLFIELPGRAVGTLRVEETVGADAHNEVSVCTAESGNIPSDRFGDLYVQDSKERR